jgi:hypothetical protein
MTNNTIIPNPTSMVEVPEPSAGVEVGVGPGSAHRNTHHKYVINIRISTKIAKT